MLLSPVLLARKNRPRAEWESLFRHLLRGEAEDLAYPLFLAALHWNGLDAEILTGLTEVLRLEASSLWEHRNQSLARNQSVLTWAHLGLQQPSAAWLVLAAQLLAAGAGQNILILANKGYGQVVGTSDVLAQTGLDPQKALKNVLQDLEHKGLACLDIASLYPNLSRFDAARQALNFPSVLDQIWPQLLALGGTQILLTGLGPQWSRWHQRLAQQFNLNLHRLHSPDWDENLLDFKQDFSLHQQAQVRHFAANNWADASCTPWQETPFQAALPAARLHRRLQAFLQGKEDPERPRALAYAALLLQIAQPQLSPQGSLAEAEAALDSGRAWQAYQNLTAL